MTKVARCQRDKALSKKETWSTAQRLEQCSANGRPRISWRRSDPAVRAEGRAMHHFHGPQCTIPCTECSPWADVFLLRQDSLNPGSSLELPCLCVWYGMNRSIMPIPVKITALENIVYAGRKSYSCAIKHDKAQMLEHILPKFRISAESGLSVP